MHLLALGDGLTVFLAAFQLVFSAVVSVSLWRLTAWQRKYEGLEGKLGDAATRLVDERFRAVASDVDRHGRAFVAALDEVKQRVFQADAEFRALGDRDQRIELSVAARLDQLKDYIRDTAATKKDLERHEAAAERRLATLERRITESANAGE